MITPYGNPLCKAAVTLCAAIFVLLLTAAADAQTGRITGTVTAGDAKGPLAGVTVEVAGPNLPRKMGAVSRADGRYAVENVPAGAYTVRATSVGYRSETVKGVGMAAGASVEVDFRMETAPYEMEEMVVSASRHAENIVDAPVSISKVDGEEIERNSAGNTFVSAIKNVKGIDYTQRGILNESFNARGLNAVLNTRMLSLIDGRISTLPSGGGGPAGASDPTTKDDIQDVEVIVGPGSALYGSDAVAGVISITTKDPRESQGTTFAIVGGSRNTFKGRFRHAGMRNRWGWKVSGEYQRAHDYEVINRFFNADRTASVTDDPDPDSNTLRGGFGLYYYPDDQSRLALVGGAIRSNLTQIVNTGRFQWKDWDYHYQQVTYTSPDLYLNIYRTADNLGDSYLLHTKAQNRLAGVPPDEAQQRARLIGESSLWGAEERYSFSPSRLKEIHFNVGVNFRQHRPNSTGIEGKKSVSQIGFYGHSETGLSEKLRIVLASRMDVHEVYGAKISPKAALVFKPRSTAAFRATFDRAFRSPTIPEQRQLVRTSPTTVARGNSRGFRFGSATGDPLPPQFADGIPKLKPQESTTFELGLKGVFAKKVFLDLSGYKSWNRNFISALRPIGDLARGIVTLDENGNPRKEEQTLTYLNFGRLTALGFDLGVDVYATDRVVLKGNVSFIEAGKLEDAGGIPQPFNTPRTIFNLGLSTGDFLVKGASLDVSLRHVSKFDYRSGVHVGTVPAYAVVDLHLGYRTKYGITYRLSATNVFDNEHIEMVDGARIGRIVVGEIQYAF
ncbi:MAG: hypothetical protein A3F84_23755 [Candidatus Handelsmanbacteria bacterium RIFCSPLOWO2_12_FULL_64_10]|uniref:TonB-dependent receptor n=1 Tax=Handelsmanbacteria sp. (strain RIFCSPLOWO2_12_FULL_64_10) TaxID=1817868 RepID=A0A1F6CBB5_HANXR|nr:MAG: hypothetical protein A3F84_23755 [Candidatus Handelsmanbacteria bacterium RIFCSPLOWO2_12_FULL_64_10]